MIIHPLILYLVGGGIAALAIDDGIGEPCFTGFEIFFRRMRL